MNKPCEKAPRIGLTDLSKQLEASRRRRSRRACLVLDQTTLTDESRFDLPTLASLDEAAFVP